MDTQKYATDRVAVVTGASAGIGHATAERLANDGYTVWAAARRTELLEKLAAEFPPGTVIAAPIDLARPSEVERLVSRIRRQTPVVHALIHSAGSYSYGAIADTTPAPLRRHYEVNVESVYRLTHDLLPLMADPADVVFLNSTQGLHAAGTVSQFAASMHARKALADALRQEVNDRGIRVVSIHLGRTATPLQQWIYESHGWRYQPELLLQSEEVATMIATIIGLPRTAEVTDVNMRPAIKSY